MIPCIMLSTATLFGRDSTIGQNIFGVAFVVVFLSLLGGLGWSILMLLRRSRRATQVSLTKLVESVAAAVPTEAGEPTVTFRFTTYTGFGLWLNQTVFDYRLPASQAKSALKKMLKHNLTRGLLGPGLIFIPFLSLWEYWTQSRNIARQLARGNTWVQANVLSKATRP